MMVTEDTTQISGEYWAVESRISRLSLRMQVLQRKAKKLDAAPITFTVTDEREMRKVGTQQTIIDGRYKTVPVYREFIKVVVAGEAPKFNGWNLVGRILHHEGANVIKM